MEWVTDYWFVILLGLVALLVFFGFRISDNKEGDIANHSKESHEDKKEHKSGGSCCH